jgi:tetratricopeptide (TPR) repeat protein
MDEADLPAGGQIRPPDPAPRLSEDLVQEWNRRLDELRYEGRQAEVDQLHRCFEVAVASRDAVTMSLHQRFAEAYLANKQPQEAAAQLELAARLGPRDLIVLHLLGLAYLEADDDEACLNVLQRMKAVDSTVLQWNVDCAGLEGRWHRRAWDRTGKQQHLEAARDAYELAMENDHGGYYMADAAGQVNLLIGDVERAKVSFERVARRLREFPEDSVWSHASGAAAAITMGDERGATAHLSSIYSHHPDQRTLETLDRTLKMLQRTLNLPTEQLDLWRDALRGVDASPSGA